MAYLRTHYNFLILWHPEIMLLAILLSLIYFELTGPMKNRLGLSEMTISKRQQIAWIGAMLCFYGAMGTPIALMADRYLYLYHMIQLSMLSVLVPPLIWASLPAELIRALMNRPSIRPIFRFWGHPLAALLIFNVVNWAWQYPSVLDFSLRSSAVFTLANYFMLIAALFLWWPIMGPADTVARRGRSGFRHLITPPWGAALSPEAQMLYLFFGLDLMMPPTILIADTTSPFYLFYMHAPHIFGMGALADQQLGALLMGVVMFVAYAIAFGASFRFYDLSSWYA